MTTQKTTNDNGIGDDYPETPLAANQDGTDHHYRVPRNDGVAMMHFRRFYHVSDRRIKKDCCPDTERKPEYICFQTIDHKGPLPYIGQYRYSKEWEQPFSKSRFEKIEVRYANGGGTKIGGAVWTTDENQEERLLDVSGVIDMTLGDVKAAANGDSDAMAEFTERMAPVIEEAWEREEQAKEAFREECDHNDHVVFDEPTVYNGEANIKAFCVDCGKTWDDFEWE